MRSKTNNMNGLVTSCLTFTLLQVAVCRAQSNDQATLQSPIQSISEPQTTEKPLQINTQTFSTLGVTDFLNDNTDPVPITSSAGLTNTPIYPSSSSSDLLNNVAAPTVTTQPASSVNVPSYTPLGGIDSLTYANPAPITIMPKTGAANIPIGFSSYGNASPAPTTSLVSTVNTPAYIPSGATSILNYGHTVPAVTTPLPSAASTQAYTPSGTNSFLNYANTAPTQTTPLTHTANNPPHTSSSATGFLNYANTAPTQTTPLTHTANNPPYTSSSATGFLNYANTGSAPAISQTAAANPVAYNPHNVNTVPPSFTPQLNGFGYPAYSSFSHFAALSPYYASMAGQSLPYPSPYANQLAYGNTQYNSSPYFPQFPMGYMTPQLPYGMIPNPAQYPPFPPQAYNFNQTRYNNSVARYPLPFPQPFAPPSPPDTPAAGTQDQSIPTVVSSTGESGTDLNSLPPQVKEFIDMIPQILDMQESSPQQPSAQHSIKPSPLRKYPKSATSPLFKKKQHYPNYPQYPNHPQRYGYYY